MKKSFIYLIIPFFVIKFSNSLAQTTLAAGDIAFTGYNAAGATAAVDDEYSFVILKNITANTKIRFTDIGWIRTTATTGSFQTVPAGTGEAVVEWTSPALTAGVEITIKNLTATQGTVSFITGGIAGQGLNLVTSGDQVLAYQGTEATPNFISAIHMNSYDTSSGNPATTISTWDGTTLTANASGLPKGLTNGVNAIWIGTSTPLVEFDNAEYNACGLDLSTQANVNLAVNNQNNWAKSNGTPLFVLPAGCNFLSAPLPVKLAAFNAKINEENQAHLQWKVADQLGIQAYVVEKSHDAKNFKIIGKVLANSDAKSDYQFLDSDLFNGKNYYRLKILEQNSNVINSKIIALDNFNHNSIKIYPNPVHDYLYISDLASYTNINAQLIDSKGIKVLEIDENMNKPVSLKNLNSGIYILKFDNGLSFKILKE